MCSLAAGHSYLVDLVGLLCPVVGSGCPTVCKEECRKHATIHTIKSWYMDNQPFLSGRMCRHTRCTVTACLVDGKEAKPYWDFTVAFVEFNMFAVYPKKKAIHKVLFVTT